MLNWSTVTVMINGGMYFREDAYLIVLKLQCTFNNTSKKACGALALKKKAVHSDFFP